MPTPRKHASAAARQAAYRQRMAQARADQLSARGLPPLPPIPTWPCTRRWAGMLAWAASLVQEAHEEMQTYYEERSAAWQESERGEAFLQRVETLTEALSLLEDLALP